MEEFWEDSHNESGQEAAGRSSHAWKLQHLFQSVPRQSKMLQTTDTMLQTARAQSL